jgi:hypothetical protein
MFAGGVRREVGLIEYRGRNCVIVRCYVISNGVLFGNKFISEYVIEVCENMFNS